MNRKSRRKPSGGLATWRIAFSADVKRRGQQKRLDRRPHRLRGQAWRPDSLLGAPPMHWNEPLRGRWPQRG